MKACAKLLFGSLKAAHRAELIALWQAPTIFLDLEFKPPGRCDDDGCVAAFKAYRDGIAEAIGVDDSRFRIASVSIIRPGSKPGWVLVTVSTTKSQDA